MTRLRSSTAGRAGVLALLFAFGSGAARAQDKPAPVPKASNSAADAAEAAAEANDQILVVAHQQKGAVATEIPPEVTLNSTTIHALGAADLSEVFSELAPEIKSGQSAPGGGIGSPVFLVDGQRIAGFSSIKDLPPEAVRRIEIFPEKVALEYGYGPGQRVINVVLRDSYRALTLLGRYTAAPENGRSVYRAKVDFLHIAANSQWSAGLDYSHQDAIRDDSTLAGPGETGPVPAHTLAAQDDHLALNAASTSKIGKVTAEFTGRIDLETLQSRPGLSSEDGDLLTAQGLGNLITGPYRRNDRTVDAQANATLNGKIQTWRWSFVGKLDENTRVTTTRAGDYDDALALNLPSPGMLGERCEPAVDGDCVSTTTRTASGDLYLNGDLFRLPAGGVTAALRTGFSIQDLHSASPIDPEHTSLSRGEGSAQANLNFPLAKRSSPLGRLSVGIEGEADKLSDFGTLTTWAPSFDWSPIERIDLLTTFTRREDAPTLSQLGVATLATPDLREYDFVQDTTSLIRQISGGNLDLARQTSYVTDARLQVKPLRITDLTVSAEYTRERIHDPIANISAATDETMAAFPDHFTRSAGGYLTSMDLSPVNLYRRDRQQIRWGLTYSTEFGSERPPGAKPPGRNQFQIALYDTWRLQDDVVLREGQQSLDLLGRDIISDKGGTPRHEIEVQTSLSTGPWSLNLNADWQPPTTGYAGPLQTDKLTFYQGFQLGLKLQINLEDQHWLIRRFPFLRGYLNISADNLLGAHLKVHDSSGGVPAAYDDEYLHPTGPTFRITLRKRFR